MYVSNSMRVLETVTAWLFVLAIIDVQVYKKLVGIIPCLQKANMIARAVNCSQWVPRREVNHVVVGIGAVMSIQALGLVAAWV